jgi:prephenate dehydrogenase
MSRTLERVAIVGVGLIGGSLGLALREAGLCAEVVGYGRSRQNLDVALGRGCVDRVVPSAAEAARGATLVVLAAPVGRCEELARAMRPHAPADALLTDVGSVKGTLVPALERAWGGGAQVVGGHPLAGSAAAGAAAARADLFRDRRCILTPTASTSAAALAQVHALWEAVGASVETMDAGVHDELLARVSHLPHLVAYALVEAVAAARVAGREPLPYAAGGFRDTTRIAASRGELWRDILLANAPAVRAGLGELRRALERLDALLAAGDGAGLEAALDAAAAVRRQLEDDAR